MEWGDVLTIGLVLVALWVFVGERLTPYRLEDGVRLAADAVRAVARRVAPLVRWLAYDVIVGRGVNTSPAVDGRVLSTRDEWDDDGEAVHPAPAPMGADGASAVQSLRTLSTDGAEPAPGAALTLTPEELQAVQRMLYAQQRAMAFGKALSKTDAIKAGFGVGRSGSNPRYQRASLIYDALLGEPEPAVKYPTLAAQRRA